jgi:hypothetical protein
MKRPVINKITVLIILLHPILLSVCDAQTHTSLQAQIKKTNGVPIENGKIFLIQAEKKTVLDSTHTDTRGYFYFENIPLGNYTIGVTVQ